MSFPSLPFLLKTAWGAWLLPCAPGGASPRGNRVRRREAPRSKGNLPGGGDPAVMGGLLLGRAGDAIRPGGLRPVSTASSPAGRAGQTSQKVHILFILCQTLPGRQVVVYRHSQGTTKLQGQGPGTGAEKCHPKPIQTIGRLCILPPGCGGRQTTPRAGVLKIKRWRPGAADSSGPLCAPPGQQTAPPRFRKTRKGTGRHGALDMVQCEIK